MIYEKEKRADGIAVLVLKNDNILVEVLNVGCTITKIIVKDQQGKAQDVVLGFDKIEDYLKKDGSYLGALAGRVCNRIAHGRFSLNGTIYQLPINNGPNCLHGGIDGFSYRFFDYEWKEDAVCFHFQSADGEEGFPGCLDLWVTYRIEGSSLSIDYRAKTDQDTIINLTNHSYFNLNGKPSYIGNHVLKIQADRYGLVDADGLHTGQVGSVEGSAFDFRLEKPIFEALKQEDPQLCLAKGLDHSFFFNAEKDQVKLYSPQTGIELTVSTTCPQAQIYSANYLEGALDKKRRPMKAQDAICIETQYRPNSINLDKDSPTILRKDEEYHEMTTYTFGVKKR